MTDEQKTYDTRLSDETTQILFSMVSAERNRLAEQSKSKMTWEEHQLNKKDYEIMGTVFNELQKAVSMGAYIRSVEPERPKLTFCEWIKSRKCGT